MEYTNIANTDMRISKLILGCMGFGDTKNAMHSWTVSQTQTEEIIAAALACGINCFDTASVYQNGTSEMYVASALSKLAKRKDYYLATKFPVRSPQDRERGISGKQHVLNSLDKSLQRLSTDYVDLYIYHMWDYHTPLIEIMEGLNEAVVSKRARYIGISNCYAWQLQKANDLAEQYGLQKFVCVQNHYNLLFREEEREMFACAKEGNIAMTPYSPLASGRLVKSREETSKRLQQDSFAKSKYDKTALQDQDIIDRVKEVADKKNMTPIQIAIAWLLSKVTAPIVGATKVQHVLQAAQGVGVQLTKSEIDYLEELYLPHSLVGVMAQNQ